MELSINYWLNVTYREIYDEIIFLCLQPVKEQKGLPKEQHSLVTTSTFKGQENRILKEFFSKNRYETVILRRSLTNKFQPLDITVNKAMKTFIQNRYSDWFSDQVARKLKAVLTDIKVLSSYQLDLKPLHTSWIVDLY